MRYRIEETEAFKILARRAAERDAIAAAEPAQRIAAPAAPAAPKSAGAQRARLVGLTLLVACAGAACAFM